MSDEPQPGESDESRPFHARRDDELAAVIERAPDGVVDALRESEERFRAIFERAGIGITLTAMDGRPFEINPAYREMVGYSEEELRAMTFAQVTHPDDVQADLDLLAEMAAGKRDRYQIEKRYIRKDGTAVWARLTVSLVRDTGGEPLFVISMVEDITERKVAEGVLRARQRQQAAVAELGVRALHDTDLSLLLDDAVRLIAHSLDTQYAAVLELLPGGKQLLMRAGTGWKDGVVGHLTMGSGTHSQAGFALASREPVIVEDLNRETRFNPPPTLHDHGIVSGLTVLIHSTGGPFGTLSAFAGETRTFTEDDVHFLQTVANVLGMAVERKRAEDSLRTSRDQLHAILQGVADGITVQDASGRLTYANTAAAEIVGYRSTDDLLAADSGDIFRRFEIYDESGQPLSAAQFPGRRVMQGEAVPEMTLRFRTRPHGEERWAILTATPIFDEHGAVEFAVNVFRDITERKSTEEVLRKSGAFQTALARVTMLASSTLELDEMLPRICDAARSGWDMLNASIFLLEGSDGLRLAASTRQDAPLGMLFPVTLRSFAAAQAVRERRVVYHNRPLDNPPEELRRLIVLASAVLVAPIFIREEVVGVLALVSGQPNRFSDADVADAMQITGAIGSAIRNARLYQREHEVAEQLRQIERWRTAFLRIMAHELRTPLGQIIGFTDLLDREADRLSERGRRYLGNAQLAARSLELLSQRSFDLMQLYGDDVWLERMPLKIRYLVKGALTAQRGAAEAKGIELVWVEASEHLAVVGDTQRLDQALDILLDNAVKFTPPGGRIELTVKPQGEQVELVVRDSGPGVPEEMREYIFAGQAEEVLTRRQGGTGLSLLMARRIAELHGGQLRLEPSEQGACFILSLPAASHDAAERTSSSQV